MDFGRETEGPLNLRDVHLLDGEPDSKVLSQLGDIFGILIRFLAPEGMIEMSDMEADSELVAKRPEGVKERDRVRPSRDGGEDLIARGDHREPANSGEQVFVKSAVHGSRQPFPPRRDPAECGRTLNLEP